MSAELLALLAAALVGIGTTLSRRGLVNHPYVSSSLLMFGTATAVLWIVALIIGDFPTQAAPYFLITGIIDPGLSILLVMLAMRNLGAVMTIPIVAMNPLVAAFMSVLFLGESITLSTILGTVLIVAGAVFLALRSGRKEKVQLRYVLAAFGAAVFIGIGLPVAKAGLSVQNMPIAGAAMYFTTGILAQAVFITVMKRWHTFPRHRKTGQLFVLSGAILGAGVVALWSAFAVGQASIVIPLLATQPLFVLVYSYLFMKGQEEITRNIVIGAGAIVAGAILVVI